MALDLPTAALSAAGLPVPLQSEIFYFTQKDVGLYCGQVRMTDYDSGVAYITSHRIVWVDSVDSKQKTAAILLSEVISHVATAGYLTRSAKIELRLQRTPSTQRTEPAIALPRNPHACSTCTFLNHPEMVECEMCGASLSTLVATSNAYASEVESPSATTRTGTYASYLSSALGYSSTTAVEDGTLYKLSFRAGGCDTFLKHLKTALDGKLWERPSQESASAQQRQPAPVIMTGGVGGIASIMKNVDQKKEAMDASLSTAFQDLDALMAKASEMVRLAESISAKLGASSGNNTSEMQAFQGYLVDLGISNPVTKESAGDLYSQELARQLAEFLEKAIVRTGGMMALTDIYCLFNRARGVELISPEDLHRSCMMFERLGLPFRLRQFESGLLVVHSIQFSDEASAEKVHAFIIETTRTTAFDLAQAQKIPVVLAMELLLIAEKKGLICRDDAVEGLCFYDNLIASTTEVR